MSCDHFSPPAGEEGGLVAVEEALVVDAVRNHLVTPFSMRVDFCDVEVVGQSHELEADLVQGVGSLSDEDDEEVAEEEVRSWEDIIAGNDVSPHYREAARFILDSSQAHPLVGGAEINEETMGFFLENMGLRLNHGGTSPEVPNVVGGSKCIVKQVYTRRCKNKVPGAPSSAVPGDSGLRRGFLVKA